MPNASPRPGLLLGLIRARARCSRVVPVLVVPCSPTLPISGGDRGPTYLRGRGFLPSRKCLGASSPPTPLNGYTFTLFRRHPCRHGRPSIRLQKIHLHYCERLVPFPMHDNTSSIQHLGDECRAEPQELQLRSPRSFQRYVVDPYQLSRLVLSPLDLAVVVMFLVQRCPLQPRTSVSVRGPQSPLECGHVLTHCACLLFRSQGCSIHSLDRESCLSTQHRHVGGHSCACLWRRPVAHQDQWHKVVPLLLPISARRFQTPAQRPKAPSLLGWYGVVRVLCIPNRRHTSSTILDPKFMPWSLCSSRKAPYRATISNTSFLATVVAFWSGMGKHSSHFEK